MTPLDWTPAHVPQPRLLQGRHVRLEPLDPPRHGDDLWEALHDRDPALWDYLPYGPFTERAAFDNWLAGLGQGRDPLFYVVVDPRHGRALGQLSLMSIVPEHGSIEIGPPGTGFGGPQPTLVLSPNDEPRNGSRRLHIDVNATDRDQDAELERLLALGAVPADVGQTGDEEWHVLADPEGNEFCLLRRRIAPVGEDAVLK